MTEVEMRKKIKEEFSGILTKEDIRDWGSGKKLPPHVYLHGRSGSVADGLNTGYCILCTDSIRAAEMYGRSGSIWAIEVDYNAPDMWRQDAALLLGDFRDSEGRYCPEIDRLIDCYSGPDGAEKFGAEINPPNIANCAGLWESPEFCCWYWEMYQHSAITTNDGAVVLDIQGVEYVGIDRAEYDKI